jgi:hypothetical protein
MRQLVVLEILSLLVAAAAVQVLSVKTHLVRKAEMVDRVARQQF